MAKKNIFIVGLDEFNLKELQGLDIAENLNFHALGNYHETQKKGEKEDIEYILENARGILDNFEGSIDGIIGYYDFPITLITFLLCEEYNLPGPSFLSGLQCEHKYWSRLEQHKVIPEQVPDFADVNPFNTSSIEDINLNIPFWLKPVKAYSSQLGFKISGQKDLDHALEQIREQIGQFAQPFNLMLQETELPDEIKPVDGFHCIAEEMIAGAQCTVSGYVYDHKVATYGIVDSINYQEKPSFFYYLYPSELPGEVQERMKVISEKVMKHFRFNNSTFNIEFFYNREKNSLHLLEINPRMSQSHSDLYAKVSGNSNHQILIQLALGEKPMFEEHAGEFKCSAKFHHCVFEDGTVTNVPGQQEIEELKQAYHDMVLFPEAEKGQRLSESLTHDSYSYRLATLFLGADSQQDLLDKYHKIIKRLNYKVEYD